MTWNLSIPVEIRMRLLKKWEDEQAGNIQDDCEHKKFNDGECVACGWICDHEEDLEESYCLVCGEFIEPSDEDPREDPEYGEDR